MKDFNSIWGGSIATVYTYLKSFENSDKYNVIHIPKNTIKSINDVREVLNNYKYDIFHVDDTAILSLLYNNNISPDVIGPITRSPIKTYNKTWKSDYTKEYFYKSKVIRLNRSEEYLENGKIDYTDKIFFINHGIDTDFLSPNNDLEKKLILWAGDSNRTAKGYDMWLKIQDMILPNNYEFRTLTSYQIKDYWKLLDSTKILVNTSLYETFCNALFEAKSKSIPSIYRKNLHNNRHLDCRIQVEYNAEDYKNEILKLLIDEDYYEKESNFSRNYTVDNFSLSRMRDTYSEVYDLIIKEKK